MSRKKSFEKNDIFSCEDLINYFPYKYYNFSKTEPFCEDGNVKLIKATVIENAKIIRARGNLTFVSCKMEDEFKNKFTAVWFNQTFVKSQLTINQVVFLYGKNSPKKKNTFNVSMMKQEDQISNISYLPVYHSIDGIGQKTINDSIIKALELVDINSVLPQNILSKHNIINLIDAYNLIHNPKTENDIEKARQSIEIEQLLPIIASNAIQKIYGKNIRINNYKNITDIKNEFISLLPYTLTNDQNKAINEFICDFSSEKSMNRLLQGDVGSGKTIVSFFGLFLAAKNNLQSAVIAPTEILARQHYETATKLFFGQNLKIKLLTSSSSQLEKNQILKELESGLVQIVIGTHSLLTKDVIFNNLSYVVIDEQHRFGVSQRASIKQKGNNPDVLVMSATPIPRSLGLVIYGNLDFSTLLSRPKEAKISTNIVIKQKQNNMWQYIKNKINIGSKVYVVCSKIDEENENDSIIQFSAKNMYDFLCNIFDKNTIGLIHGKLKKETQDKVIENFKMGKIKILVSTTIVEVGVDIPDSDIMVIATPERFGLATLHQLRGRIGRNGKESHCFCLADNLNEKSYQRINYFKNNLNGFDIAEFDLKTRGAGSMYGTNQHGEDNNLLTNYSTNALLLSKQIFEEIKSDNLTMQKLINIYNSQNSPISESNIILN